MAVKLALGSKVVVSPNRLTYGFTGVRECEMWRLKHQAGGCLLRDVIREGCGRNGGDGKGVSDG